MENILRIAVVGPESTGKSELCQKLAEHYDTVFAPEFAREYLHTLGRPYTYEDVEYILEQQLRLEKEREPLANRILFCDTTPVSIKIWFEVVFKKVPGYLQSRIREVKYDLYLLTDIDMPWVEDPLREHPHFRAELLEMHKRELHLLNAPYQLISGTGNLRMGNAIQAIDDLMH